MIAFNTQELEERIVLNYNRLESDPYYQIPEVFSPADYDWYGDKEGRALLAFVSHYKISGKKISCMEQLVKDLPAHTNEALYFGPPACDIIHEQQLSGHSWLLRGLCEYQECFADAFTRNAIHSIVTALYLPLLGKVSSYPVDRSETAAGDVSGNSLDILNGWHLSSDIGCAFMSIDGLSHAWQILKEPALKTLIDEMIDVYSSIDKAALKAQTHCTLTAARGMLRMHGLTGDGRYLDHAKAIYKLYVSGGGMTYTYQNLNWWNRPDSWTEPCAIVDSLMLALLLYQATGEEHYRKTATRIYTNGFASLQRDNGGAGTDTLLCPGSSHDSLFAQMYEAFFCCTMRLAEGLWFISEHTDQLWSESGDTLIQNEHGIYQKGDYIYAEITGGGEAYAEEFIEQDGHRLSPLLKYYKIPKEIMENTKQKLLFQEGEQPLEIDLNIRDPFFLKEEDTYYLYGTHGGKLYVFYGSDLQKLEKKLIFEDTEGLYTKEDYWAPEVHKIDDTYYMIATFKKENETRRCWMLTCDTPNGTFVPMEQPLTPLEWDCLDGTLWTENNKRYLFFCHEWTQIGDGTICVAELDEAMRIKGEITTLFAASEAPWSLPYPGNNYVTDGPFLYRLSDGRLLMGWSGFGEQGYTLGMAVADTVLGPWTQLEEPLLKKDGGHGMFFEDNGSLYVSYHSPNTGGLERVQLRRIVEADGKLSIAGKR